MTDKKLSERLKILIENITHTPILFMDIVTEVESLEQERDLLRARNLEYEEQAGQMITESSRLKEQLDKSQQMLDMTGYTYMENRWKSAEAKVQKLTEENQSWERWNRRCIETKNEWGKKLTEAESEVKRLEGELDVANELNHGLDYCAEQSDLKRQDAEARVAEANNWADEWIKALEATHLNVTMTVQDFNGLKIRMKKALT